VWRTVLVSVINDPVRLYLLVGDVLATFAVGLGIVSEHGPESVRKVANRLVIGGVVAETIFSVILFVYDGVLSSTQQEKIVQLESQRALSETQKDRIATVAGLYRLKFVVFTNPETEAWNLALQIGETLKADGWTWEPCAIASRPSLQAVTGAPAECTTLVDHIEVDAPPDLLPVADALADAIREPDVYGMDRVWPDPNAKTGAITIMVGSKR
jgi:hypothetical protein